MDMDIYTKKYNIDKAIKYLKQLKLSGQPVCGALYYLLRKLKRAGKENITLCELMEGNEIGSFEEIITEIHLMGIKKANKSNYKELENISLSNTIKMLTEL